jgi:hypothetical protein
MSIMRTCGELRNEIRAIHPSVLEARLKTKMEKGGHEDVDYNTLLSFARRIDKHNIRAAGRRRFD